MTLLEEMYNLLHSMLLARCPVLSGNTKKGIKLMSYNENEIVVEIEAPFYDIKEWTKTGHIVYTNKKIKGRTDYAAWVNDYGAFCKHNASEGWVNRACLSTAIQMASLWESDGYDVEIDYRLWRN